MTLGSLKPAAALLQQTAERAIAYLDGLPERSVGAAASIEQLRAGLDVPLQDGPLPGDRVVAELAAAVEPGLVASAGPRYFGFVIGGSLPAALAADWLVGAWDQNAGGTVVSPAAAVVEEVCGGWLKDLLGLPATASFGFVTGGQMANLTGLLAGRHEVLRRAGWDVEVDGLTGAPPLQVIVGAERHVTIDRALRILGIGTKAVIPVPVDAQGRLRADALAEVLAGRAGPAIVCAQAGHVDTGAIDPLRAVCDLAHEAGAWVHVDGAFGLWAGASPVLRPLLDGVEQADSWATDAHKWLNVPYDSGLVFVAEPQAHRAALRTTASYLVQTDEVRDALNYNPELSRRARGVPVYTALRTLGRSGVSELVERCCALARRFADRLSAEPGIEILNDVVLNQVLVRLGDDAHTRAVIERVQRDGVCWLAGTVRHGRAAMRISVSNWSTTVEDVDRSVAAILAANAR